MRPAVVTAVLMLVCILYTETAVISPSRTCGRFQDSPCSDGWSRIDENRCAKLIRSPKTFHEAQEHCRTLNGDLLSIHSSGEMLHLLCLLFPVTLYENFWIGATRSEGGFRYTDGSEFDYNMLLQTPPDNPDGQEDCVELNVVLIIFLNNVGCSEKRNFVCAKKM